MAKAAGITLYQIREMLRDEPKDPIRITGYSIIFASQKPDKIAWEQKIMIPALGEVRMTLNSTWLADNPDANAADMGTGVAPDFHKVHFVDDAGNVSSSVASMIQATVGTFGRTGRTELKRDFSEPTYIVGLTRLNREGNPVGKVKILHFSVALDVTVTTSSRPLFSSIAATYLFKNAMEEDGRYVLVAENGGEMAAQLSVPRVTLQIG